MTQRTEAESLSLIVKLIQYLIGPEKWEFRILVMIVAQAIGMAVTIFTCQDTVENRIFRRNLTEFWKIPHG